MDPATLTVAGLTVTEFASPNITQWTNNAGFITAGSTDTLTNKTISGASNTLSNIGNASLVNSTVGVTAGTGLTGGGVTALGASTTLSVSGLTVTEFASPNIGQWTNNVGYITASSTDTLTNKTISGLTNTLSSIANASLVNSTVGVTAGTGLTGGGVVALGGSATLNVSGLTTTEFASANIGQWTNNVGYITASSTDTLTNKSISGLTNTLSSIANASLVNSTVGVTAGTGLTGGGVTALGASTTLSVSGLTVTEFASPNISQWTNDSGFITTSSTNILTNKTISGVTNTLTNIGNASLVNSAVNVNAGTGLSGGGNIALGGSATLNVTGLTTAEFTSPNVSQWTNDANYITAGSTDTLTNKSISG